MNSSVRIFLVAATVLAAACATKPAPDLSPPTLVDRHPAVGADNVWAFAPISLTFSEPLAAASVLPALFEVKADGEPAPLGVDVKLAADRRTVEVRLADAPPGPTALTLNVKSGLRDEAGNSFDGVSWSWKLPLWHDAGTPPREGAVRALSRPVAIADARGQVLVAWQESGDSGGSGAGKGELGVALLSESGWARVPAPAKQQADSDAGSPRVAVTSEGFVLAWLERGASADVQVRRWDGAAWVALGASPDGAAEADAPTLFADEAGALVVAWVEGKRQVQLARWQMGAWQPATKAYASPGTITGYDFTVHAGRPVLALAEKGAASADLTVQAWDAAAQAWRPLGTALDRLAADEVANPALALGPQGALGLAWQEHDTTSDHVYAARFDGDWKLLGLALDLDIDAPTGAPRMQFTATGEPVVAWREGASNAAWSYVARFQAPLAGAAAAGALPGSAAQNGRWLVLGGVSSVAGPDAALALVLDRRGHPALIDAPAATKALATRRFNGTPRLPYGLAPRSGAPGCALPEEGNPNFPRTLSATGCFTELAQRTPAAGVLPYEVVSPLWSDGSLKRRFLVLPAGKTFTYQDYDSFATPPGTIFIKEFILEREPGNPNSRTPMETRLLVKRCEEGDCEMPWQGYSYQWNDASTDAVLLSNQEESEYKDWPTAGGMHRHTYPGQTQCGRCHLLASGGTLGIQASQLNRSFNYGGVVDNQLRALEHAGVLTRPGTVQADFASAPRVPAPHDVSFSLERRVRGYFQGNCGHCHRPGGAWPVMDFRYHIPLPASRLCQIITPGDSEHSRLFIKTMTRDIEKLPDGTTGRPMPPLGSLLLDPRQLTLLRSWIDSLKTCP